MLGHRIAESLHNISSSFRVYLFDIKLIFPRLEQSRAQRILWLLEELKVDYELKTYKRNNRLAPPELKDIHPLGKSPLLTVEAEGAAKPMVLAESAHIVEYLIDHYGSWLVPKRYPDGKEGQVGGETEEWMRYRYYMHYAEGTLMPYLIVKLIVNREFVLILFSLTLFDRLRTVVKGSVPFFIKPISNTITGAIEKNFLEPNFKTNFGFLESQLASSPNGGKYLCGRELTGADFIMEFPLWSAKNRVGFTQKKYPLLWAYVERLEAIDSHKRAVQKIIQVEGSYHPNL